MLSRQSVRQFHRRANPAAIVSCAGMPGGYSELLTFVRYMESFGLQYVGGEFSRPEQEFGFSVRVRAGAPEVSVRFSNNTAETNLRRARHGTESECSAAVALVRALVARWALGRQPEPEPESGI